MLFYRAALRLSSQTLAYTAGVIRRHRKQIGSPWRKLSPEQQALPALAYLRKGETFAELAAGQKAKKAGHAYVVIDGTLIAIDRLAADRPFYSGKHPATG